MVYIYIHTFLPVADRCERDVLENVGDGLYLHGRPSGDKDTERTTGLFLSQRVLVTSD